MNAAPVLALMMCAMSAKDVPMTLEEQVDLVEVNHFYDEKGKHVFNQVIFYEWSPHEGRNQVRAWRLVKKSGQLPLRDWKNGGYRMVWLDSGVLRSIRAKELRETWTQYDPELIEREILPMDRRRDLARPYRNR